MTNEIVDVLNRRIKALAENSTPDQLAYLAKSLELITDKKVISNIVQMTAVKEIIDTLQKRLKSLAENSTPDQLAYLAKAFESIVDKSAVSEIIKVAEEKLKELLDKTNAHLSNLNTNKTNALTTITESEKQSLKKIDEKGVTNLSLLDTRKNANIAAINSRGEEQLSALTGLVSNFKTVNDVPSGSSIMKEIKTREDQLKIFAHPNVLLDTINNNDLETWLKDAENQRRFDKILSNASAILNVTGNSSALDKLINSKLGVQALLKNSVALNIIANTIAIDRLIKSTENKSMINVIAASPLAMTTIAASSMAMTTIAASSMAMTTIAASPMAMTTIAASSIAMTTIANSGEALKTIIQSESACKIIEHSIQNYRSAVISTLNASSSSFRKQSGVTVGNGVGTIESGANSPTIYVPTSCHDDNDTDFSMISLLTGVSRVYVSRHSGTTSVSNGIFLRGVRVSGVGSSVGNIIFDVYTAI
jgi:hypothetical protein